MRYEIEPGSDLDQALDRMITESWGGEPCTPELFALVDPQNRAHMVALGARTWLATHRGERTPPPDGPELAVWYGGLAADAPVG